MPLTNEQRARFQEMVDQGHRFIGRHGTIIHDATEASLPVDVEYRYLAMNQAAAALERDAREREAGARKWEMRLTLVVATIAAIATALQAWAMVWET